MAPKKKGSSKKSGRVPAAKPAAPVAKPAPVPAKPAARRRRVNSSSGESDSSDSAPRRPKRPKPDVSHLLADLLKAQQDSQEQLLKVQQESQQQRLALRNDQWELESARQQKVPFRTDATVLAVLRCEQKPTSDEVALVVFRETLPPGDVVKFAAALAAVKASPHLMTPRQQMYTAIHQMKTVTEVQQLEGLEATKREYGRKENQHLAVNGWIAKATDYIDQRLYLKGVCEQCEVGVAVEDLDWRIKPTPEKVYVRQLLKLLESAVSETIRNLNKGQEVVTLQEFRSLLTTAESGMGMGVNHVLEQKLDRLVNSLTTDSSVASASVQRNGHQLRDENSDDGGDSARERGHPRGEAGSSWDLKRFGDGVCYFFNLGRCSKKDCKYRHEKPNDGNPSRNKDRGEGRRDQGHHNPNRGQKNKRDGRAYDRQEKKKVSFRAGESSGNQGHFVHADRRAQIDSNRRH